MYGPNGSGDGKSYYMGTLTVGPSALDIMMQGGMGLNMGGSGAGMFAGNSNSAAGSRWYRSKTGDHGESGTWKAHVHKDSPNGQRYNREGKPVDARGYEEKGPKSIKKSQLDEFQKQFDRLNPPRPGAAAAGGEAAELGGDVAAGAELGGDLTGPAGLFVGAAIGAYDWYHNGPPRFTFLVPGPGYPL